MNIHDFLARFDTEGVAIMPEVCSVENRDYCVRYMVGKAFASQAQALDVFKDAILILFNNAAKGKIKPGDAQITTYLVSVCHNLLRKKGLGFEPLPLELVEDLPTPYEDPELLSRLRECIQKLDERQQQLVKMWMDGLPYKDIFKLLGYASDNSAKSTFYKCLKILRTCTQSFI